MRKGIAAALASLLIATTAIQGQTGKNFLWKVEDKNGSVAYLLGSIHVLSPEWYPLNPVINKAFADSKLLIEEVDIDETNDPAVMMAALAKAMLTDGKTLDQIVSPEVYAEVKRRGEKSGLPMMAIQRMKPWLVAITLMAPTLQAAGFKPELGIDQHFFDLAKASGMPRDSLETIAYQLDRFDQMSPKLQEDLLKTTMEDLDSEVSGVKEMAQAWSFGNVAEMEQTNIKALKESPELYQRLLVERNHNWVPRIETCLKQKSGCFVVVGAAHLVGSDGLPALLAKQGYTVTQQ
jgi:uncharacterized protein YbaP (TraB family)